MGCTTSCVAPSVAELNKSLKAGDERKLIHTLATCPKLLSSTSILGSIAITPFHVACENKQAKVVDQILQFLSCSTLDVVKEALMSYCRRVGKPLPTTIVEGVRLAVDMVNGKGQTPLMYACFADCPELVKLLLANGADPWAGDRCGNRTPLHYAALGGSSACIAALMKHMPPRMLTRQGTRYVNARSCCGLTPLHYCAFFGHCEAVRELLHHDPNINAVSTSESYDVSVTCEVSSSPLHFAAVRGNEAVARELLQYYAQRLASGQPIADPRDSADAAGQLPWQVALAHHPANLSLAAMLHPGQNIHRVLGVATSSDNATPGTGPASLATIAAAAVREKLLGQVQAVEEARAAMAPASPSATTVTAVGQSAGESRSPGDAQPAITPLQSPAQAEQPSGSGACPSCSGDSSGQAEACRKESAQAAGADGISCRKNLRVSVSAGSSTSSCVSTRLECSTEALLGPTLPSCASGTSTTSSHVSEAAAASFHGSDPVSTTKPCTSAGSSACGQMPLRTAAGARYSGRYSGSGDEGDDDDEEALCGVCFAADKAVTPAGCGHGVCAECAVRLCQGISRKPLRCPFCRRVVTGLVACNASGL